jgi:hypothetical protein
MGGFRCGRQSSATRSAGRLIVFVLCASALLLAVSHPAAGQRRESSPTCNGPDLGFAVSSWKETLTDWRLTLRSDIARRQYESAAFDGGALADSARHAQAQLAWYRGCPAGFAQRVRAVQPYLRANVRLGEIWEQSGGSIRLVAAHTRELTRINATLRKPTA